MAQCIYHPQYPAVEQCEVCHVPLCGQCLWYAESGERLCERCARSWQKAGRVVLPPEQFAEGIVPTLAAASRPQQSSLYTGNHVDLLGLAAACLGGTIFLSCVPCLNASMPLLGLLFGLVALVEANKAVNPGRTRILAGIGLSGGVLIILGILFWFVLAFFMPLMGLIVESLFQTP